MRGPSLQKTAALSFLVHLTVFLLFFLVFRQSNYMVVPDHYMVNLVSPGVLPKVDRADDGAVERRKEESARQKEASAAETRRQKMQEKEDARERDDVNRKISLMAAKKRMEKRFGARKVISLKAGGEKPSRPAKGAAAKSGPSKALPSAAPRKGVEKADDYYSRVVDEIRQQWVWASADSGRRDIEAIVSIRIYKDGNAIILGWEKKSGDSLFDKSALRALAKANPLPPPPYEMEIGVRFYP